MALLLGLLWPIQRGLDVVLAIGRALAVASLALMVCFILYQIVLRYAFNSAPNWTEEGARFLMLWMTGFIAPLAYRQGGFVAIDMFERALPRLMSQLVILTLLICAMIVLYFGVTLGWDNVNSFTGRGRSASLRLPLEWVGGDTLRFKNSYAYASLFMGFCLLMVVNLELILRQVISIMGGEDRLRKAMDAGPID